MKRTVSIPVDLPSERFLPLMAECAEIFNAHIDWALANSNYNKNRAHRDLYADLRQKYPNVPSALLQTVRDNAMEAIKATKFKRTPRKKPTSGLCYDKRTMTLRGQQLTLSCKGKRQFLVLTVPEYFREVFETWKFCGATLTYTKAKKQFWVRLVFETESPQPQSGGRAQGIDRGPYHLVTTSGGQFFSGSPIRASQRRYLHNRKTLQQKGTCSAKRRLRAMSDKEKRFMKDVVGLCPAEGVHCVSKQLVAAEAFTVFVLKDLSSIRTQRRGRKLNKWLSSWTFYQFEQFLAYKPEAAGKRIAFVDARYISQKCSLCKHVARTNRKKSRFHCRNCGHQAHADINAAVNVRDSHILSTAYGSVEQAAVNLPDAAGHIAS